MFDLSSQFQLMLSENHASVIQYTGNDYTEFSSIAYLPVKDSNDYYTLADIIVQVNEINGRLLNILAVVRDVSGLL